MVSKKFLAKTATIGSGVSLLVTSGVHAQISGGIGATQSSADSGASDLTTVVQRVITILLWIVGAASVVMLIVGGIRYVISAGDQSAVTNAKNTILYAIVGIIVAILAYAAVNFVFNVLTTGSSV